MRSGRPISASTLPKMLQYHQIAAVAHGFRSSFRDWAAEETDHPREVIEAALAHVVQNKVEAAYARVGPVRASAAAHERLVGLPRCGARASRPVATPPLVEPADRAQPDPLLFPANPVRQAAVGAVVASIGASASIARCWRAAATRGRPADGDGGRSPFQDGKWQPKTAHFRERHLGRRGRSPVDAHRACWAGRRERSDRSPGQHAPRRCGAGGHDATPSRRSSDAVRSQC